MSLIEDLELVALRKHNMLRDDSGQAVPDWADAFAEPSMT